MGDPDRKGSAVDDLSTALKVTAWLLTLLSLGLPGLWAKLTAADEDVVVVARVLALTAPFSLWVAITILVAVHGKLAGHVQFLLSAAVLVGLTLLGNWIGVGTGVSLGGLWDESHGNVPKAFAATLVKYAFHYGAGPLVSALVVGIFLAYAWWRLFMAGASTTARRKPARPRASRPRPAPVED